MDKDNQVHLQYNISSMWETVEVAKGAHIDVVDPYVVTFKPNHHPLGYPLTR